MEFVSFGVSMLLVPLNQCMRGLPAVEDSINEQEARSMAKDLLNSQWQLSLRSRVLTNDAPIGEPPAAFTFLASTRTAPKD